MKQRVATHYICLAIGASIAGLAGCTLVPAYQRPAAPVAVQYPADGKNATPVAANTPAPTSANASTAVAAELGWRTVFADERLQALMELALANNRDLRVAVLRVEQSQAQYRVTSAASLPGINAGASTSAQHAQGITTHQASANIAMSAYVLDFFGKVRSLNAQALEQYLATAEAQRSARIALVAELATQYYAWLQAQAQLDLALQTLVTRQESLRLNQATFDAGAANELDLRTAEGEVQNARINVLTYERQLQQARNALELLLGAPLPATLPAARSLQIAAQMRDIPVGTPSDLLTRRPDILQAEHTLRAANANIGAARAAFFPSITLTAAAGSASPQLSGLFSSGNGTWNFTPQLNLPLFTGGANRAALAAARVSARISVAQYEKAIQTAFREVADALIANRSYADVIEAQAAAIEAQQRRLALATVRYRQGEDNYLNVLTAQQSLYGAQQGLLSAQYSLLASRISLYQALGGGWQ